MQPEMTSTKQRFKFWEQKTGNRLVFVIVPRTNMVEFKEQLRPLLVLNLSTEQVEEFLQKRVISKEAFDTFMHPNIYLPWRIKAMRPFIWVKSGDQNIPYPNFSRLWEDLNQKTDNYLQPHLTRWADKLEELLKDVQVSQSTGTIHPSLGDAQPPVGRSEVRSRPEDETRRRSSATKTRAEVRGSQTGENGDRAIDPAEIVNADLTSVTTDNLMELMSELTEDIRKQDQRLTEIEGQEKSERFWGKGVLAAGVFLTYAAAVLAQAQNFNPWVQFVALAAPLLLTFAVFLKVYPFSSSTTPYRVMRDRLQFAQIKIQKELERRFGTGRSEMRTAADASAHADDFGTGRSEMRAGADASAHADDFGTGRSEMRTAAGKKENYTISQADPRGYPVFSKEAERLAAESEKIQDRDGQAMFKLLEGALKFPDLMMSLWVVRNQRNRVIGFYALGVDPRLGWQGYLDEQKRHPGIKTAMAVSAAYRGQGIGRALWHTAFEFMKGQSIRYVVDTPLSEKSFLASKQWAAEAGAVLIPMGLAPKFHDSSRSFLIDLKPSESGLDWLAADAVAPEDAKTLAEWIQWIQSRQIRIGNIYQHVKNDIEMKVVGLNSLEGSFKIQAHQNGKVRSSVQIIPHQNVKAFLSEFTRRSEVRAGAYAPADADDFGTRRSEMRSARTHQPAHPEVVRLYTLLDRLIQESSARTSRIQSQSSGIGLSYDAKSSWMRNELLRVVKEIVFDYASLERGHLPESAAIATANSFASWKAVVAVAVERLRKSMDNFTHFENELEGDKVFVLNTLWQEYRQVNFKNSKPLGRLSQTDFEAAWQALLETSVKHTEGESFSAEWADANGLIAAQFMTRESAVVRIVHTNYISEEYQIWYLEGNDWVRIDQPSETLNLHIMSATPDEGGLKFQIHSGIFENALISVAPNYQHKGVGEAYFKWRLEYATRENLTIEYKATHPAMIYLAEKYRKASNVRQVDFAFKQTSIDDVERILFYFTTPFPVHKGDNFLFQIQFKETLGRKTIVIQDAAGTPLQTLDIAENTPVSFTVGDKQYQVRMRNGYSAEIKEETEDWKPLYYAAPIRVRIATQPPTRSEMRRPAQPASRSSARAEPDVQVFANKRILINFPDMANHFSDKEILEVLGIAQRQNQNVQTLIYNLDYTVDFRFARFLKSLESEHFKVAALSLEQMTKEYTQGFTGEVLHLSSADSKMSAQRLQRQLSGSVAPAQVYSFSYQDEDSGTLGVGLRDLSAGLLKRDLLQADELRKPGYFGYDKNGNLIITDAAQAGTAAWIQSYDQVLVFSRAA